MKRFLTAALCLMLALSLLGCAEQSEPMGEVKLAEDGEPFVPVPTAISYSDGTVTARFATDETGAWCWVDDTGFPLDETYIQTLLDTMTALRELTPLPIPEDLGTYGLETPTRYLAASYNDESRVIFYFGKQSDTGSWYMRTEEAEKVYVVPEEIGSLLSRSVYDMMLLPVMPELTMDNVKLVTIKNAEEKTLVLTVTNGAWRKGSDHVSEAQTAAAQAVLGMTLDVCVDYTPAQGALEVCGLLPPAAQVTVVYENSVGSDVEETVCIGNFRESANGYYVTCSDDPSIYLMSADTVNTILSALQ